MNGGHVRQEGVSGQITFFYCSRSIICPGSFVHALSRSIDVVNRKSIVPASFLHRSNFAMSDPKSAMDCERYQIIFGVDFGSRTFRDQIAARPAQWRKVFALSSKLELVMNREAKSYWKLQAQELIAT